MIKLTIRVQKTNKSVYVTKIIHPLSTRDRGQRSSPPVSGEKTAYRGVSCGKSEFSGCRRRSHLYLKRQCPASRGKQGYFTKGKGYCQSSVFPESSSARRQMEALVSSFMADLMVTFSWVKVMFLLFSRVAAMTPAAAGAQVPFSMKATVRF